ncbi:MAG TPA: hypothetical protein VFI22_16270, partial [Thermomicrobiales bacterium]|nr:hypothetical protein [Thermomicrobiales bacterium]
VEGLEQVLDALRWMAHASAAPPAGRSAAVAHDLRAISPRAASRKVSPTGVNLDRAARQAPPKEQNPPFRPHPGPSQSVPWRGG